MAQFRPVSDVVFVPSEELGEDAKYWKNLEFPVHLKKHGPVTHLEFSPVKPYNFVATSSVTVNVHKNSTPYTEVLSLKGFKETAYSGSFRHDGQLIVAGGEHAGVQVFKDKISLRKFTGHSGSVHLTRFTSSNFHIFSGSDDKTVRYWDLPTGSEVICFNENQDYVRCGAASLTNKDFFVTGSYDKTVKLFDVRTKASVLTMNHNAHVESVLIHPSGGLVISAGDNVVKVWDTMAGGRLLATLANHHKTVTALCYSHNYQRLVSASLDRHVKFYDVVDYKVVHSMEYPSSILSLAIAPDDSLVAVGMTDGLLSVQHRKEDDGSEMKRKMKTSTSFKKKKLVLDEDDRFCKHIRKPILADYDKCLKKFEHAKAFDAAMSIRTRRKSPETTFAVLKQLLQRNRMRSALAGRDDAAVADIFKFLTKNYCVREFKDVVSEMICILLDLYGEKMPFMASATFELEKLRTVVDTTLKADMEMKSMTGSLMAILASSYQHTMTDADETLQTD